MQDELIQTGSELESQRLNGPPPFTVSLTTSSPVGSLDGTLKIDFRVTYECNASSPIWAEVQESSNETEPKYEIYDCESDKRVGPWPIVSCINSEPTGILTSFSRFEPGQKLEIVHDMDLFPLYPEGPEELNFTGGNLTSDFEPGKEYYLSIANHHRCARWIYEDELESGPTEDDVKEKLRARKYTCWRVEGRAVFKVVEGTHHALLFPKS